MLSFQSILITTILRQLESEYFLSVIQWLENIVLQKITSLLAGLALECGQLIGRSR